MQNIKVLHKEFRSSIFKDRIVKKAIAGDKEAFSDIVKEHKEYLYKTAFMYMKDEEKALEVLQETIIRGFINIKKLKNVSYFKTWITRILINVSLDMIKKDSKNEEFKEEHIKDHNVSNGLGIEERLDLYSSVDLLNDNYKTVIILKYFNDLKIQDIALVMDIPENTVKTYLSRAKKMLKDILKEGYLND